MKFVKHYANASDSVKVNQLIDDLGLEGYARWWLLLELLASEFDGECIDFEIHFSKLSAKLRLKFVKKLNTFFGKLSELQLISFQVSGKVYNLRVPIILKLKDRHYKKSSKTPNEVADEPPLDIDIDKEIIDKDIESAIANQASALNVDHGLETEIKFKENSTAPIVNPFRARDLWNEILMPLGFSEAKYFRGGDIPKFIKFSKAVGQEKDWREMLTKCSDSSFLKNCGAFSFAWFFDEDKQMKMINGQYYDVAAGSGGIQELLDAEQSKT